MFDILLPPALFSVCKFFISFFNPAVRALCIIFKVYHKKYFDICSKMRGINLGVALSNAFKLAATIGVCVWIYRGAMLPGNVIVNTEDSA